MRVAAATTEAERHQARRRWLTTREAGEMIGGITANQVRALIAGKALRALDVSRPGAKQKEYRIRPEWCEEFEAAHTTVPQEEHGEAAAS